MSGSIVSVGIDVASTHVDVAVLGAALPKRCERVSNDQLGQEMLVQSFPQPASAAVKVERPSA